MVELDKLEGLATRGISIPGKSLGSLGRSFNQLPRQRPKSASDVLTYGTMMRRLREWCGRIWFRARRYTTN